MSNIAVTIDGHRFEIELHREPSGHLQFAATVDGVQVEIHLPEATDASQPEWMVIGHRAYEITIDPDLRWIESYRGRHRIELRDRDAAVTRPISADGRIKAPIPGLITRVMVEAGQAVEVGQPLMILEAMKMETRSARRGRGRSSS